MSYLRLRSPCGPECKVAYDKLPYYADDCPDTYRRATACNCTCLEFVPAGDAPEGAVKSNWLVSYFSPVTCFCDNADDKRSLSGSALSSVVVGFDQSGILPGNWLSEAVKRSCPDIPKVDFRFFASKPTTNLACVRSSADWDSIALDGGTGVNPPEPAWSDTWSGFLFPPPMVGVGGGIRDCGTLIEYPEALLVEVVDGCGVTILLCPTRLPSGVSFECPPCSYECMSLVTDSTGTFSTADGDSEGGTSAATIKFNIRCPTACSCEVQTGVANFTLGGTTVPVPFSGACGETIVVGGPTLPYAPGDEWEVSLSWTCSASSEYACTPPANCNGVGNPCDNTASGGARIAVGGGVI